MVAQVTWRDETMKDLREDYEPDGEPVGEPEWEKGRVYADRYIGGIGANFWRKVGTGFEYLAGLGWEDAGRKHAPDVYGPFTPMRLKAKPVVPVGPELELPAVVVDANGVVVPGPLYDGTPQVVPKTGRALLSWLILRPKVEVVSDTDLRLFYAGAQLYSRWGPAGRRWRQGVDVPTGMYKPLTGTWDDYPVEED